jgi:glycosyl transferase, family 25
VKTFVINLESSTDRRAFMQRNLDRLGVEFSFFRGIDARRGEHLTVSRYDLLTAIRQFKRPLSTGEIGCFASHYLLWQQCIIEKEPVAIIEDDVLIADEFPRALSAARLLIDELNLIRLGFTHNADKNNPAGTLQGFEIVRYLSNQVLGTQGYVLSPVAAEKLVAHAAVWWLPVDLYMHRAEEHGVDSYGFHPLPVMHADQNAYPTVIGMDRYDGFRITEQVVKFLSERNRVLY